jgi:sarcosine oxidase subunit gamma
MMALLRRTGAQELEVWVFRSMAATAVHEIGTAMRSLAARAALAP